MHAPVSIQKVFGHYIAELRQRAGLRIEQLAEKSGLSRGRLNAIERGDVNLNLGTILVLAMSLDTAPQEIFSDIGKRIGRDAGSCFDAFESGGTSPSEEKLRQLWIGSVEVRPLIDCTVFDYSQGAFVNVVKWASDANEYSQKLEQALTEKRLFVIEIASAEPVETKRKRDGAFDASVEEIIADAARNPRVTPCSEFHTYLKTDA